MALKYVSIYCNAKAVKDWPYATNNRQDVGRCLAQNVRGRWSCCCCGRPVKVVLR